MIVTSIILKHWEENLVVMFKRKQVLYCDLMTGIKHDRNVHISVVERTNQNIGVMNSLKQFCRIQNCKLSKVHKTSVGNNGFLGVPNQPRLLQSLPIDRGREKTRSCFFPPYMLYVLPLPIDDLRTSHNTSGFEYYLVQAFQPARGKTVRPAESYTF